MEGFSSRKRKEFLEFFLVVLILGIVTNLISDTISVYLNKTFLYISLKYWLLFCLLVSTVVIIYKLILPETKINALVYTSLMVDEKNKTLYHSHYAPWAIRFASSTIWPALEKDNFEYKMDLIKTNKNSSIPLDFLEHLIFQVLSGFEPFWLSKKIKTYGYTSRILYDDIDRKPLAERPSTIYSFKIHDDKDLSAEYKRFVRDVYLMDLMKENKITMHLLKSSLEHVSSPNNWIIMMPMDTSIKVNRERPDYRQIRFINRFVTVDISLSSTGGGIGLPYGIIKHVENYDRSQYSHDDFKIEISVSFSRLLLLSNKMKYYETWIELMMDKIGFSFGYDRSELGLRD